MPGTGDEMISRAQSALDAAQREYDRNASSQASAGHEGRLRDAERARDQAARDLANAKSRWG
jgi:hypothetical protein